MPEPVKRGRGRPPVPPGHVPPSQRINARLPNELVAWLKAQPEGLQPTLRAAVELLKLSRQ